MFFLQPLMGRENFMPMRGGKEDLERDDHGPVSEGTRESK
ncbi:MAG: hypothetical protein NVSMB27_35090 [Ktedonobacteraceae bacterium]